MIIGWYGDGMEWNRMEFRLYLSVSVTETFNVTYYDSF